MCCCLVVALAGLWGCDDGRSARLRAIDAIMEDDPALALAQLNSVDAATLSDADYPYYCLLYTQAQVKNYIVLTDDSLIAVAYGAYADCSDADLRRRANFYNAKVAYYAKDYRTAMRDILPAYEIAKEQNDPYWTAKAAEIIGDIYFQLFNYSSAEEYKREAALKYKEAGRELNHRYALSDLNATLMNEGKEEEALRLIDSLHTIVKSEVPMDTDLYEYVKMSLFSYYVKTGQTDELHKLIDQGLTMNEGDDADMDIAILVSNALNNEGQTDEAELYLTKANDIAPGNNDRARVLYASFKQSLRNNDYAKAATLGDTLIYMQSNLMRDVINESVTGVQRDFYHVNADKNKREARTLFWVIAGMVVLIVLIIIVLLVFHRLRINVKNSRLETLLASIQSYEAEARASEAENARLEMELTNKSQMVYDLHQELDVKDKEYEVCIRRAKEDRMNDTSVAGEEMEKLLRNRWSTLNMLCNEYHERWDNEKARTTILEKIGAEIERETSRSRLKEVEQTVDTFMGGIMTLLRKELPNLSKETYILAMLLLAGFECRAVSLFMNIKPDTFYKRRSRLLAYITNSEAAHKELFCEKIKKSQNIKG